MEKPVTLTLIPQNKLTPDSGVKSLLFCIVCSVKSDRILVWSNKDGFYTSFQGTGGLSSATKDFF